MLNIEVVYADLENQWQFHIKIAPESVIADVLLLAQQQPDWPEINIDPQYVGVFGQIKPLSTVLKEGDRIEIYRPLIADPKTMRRQRAAQKKQ